MIEGALLGRIQDVDGPTISVQVDVGVPTGLMFSDGEPHSPGQVGSFVRIAVGFVNLIAVITRAGAGAIPESLREQPIGGSRWVTAQLVGESVPGEPFSRGVARLPGIGDKVYIVTESDLRRIYGDGSEANGYFAIGHIAAAVSIKARIDINRLVTRHSAVLGSTGSGKSTTVARIAEVIAGNALASSRALLFDLHGEYARSLGDEANVFSPGGDGGSLPLYVPFWALTFDELLPLTLGSIADDAGRAHVRDEIVRLKKAAFATTPRPGLTDEEITVDSPIPFSLRQLWFDLHNYLNATHTAASTGQTPATRAYATDAAGASLVGSAKDLVAPTFLAQDQSAGGTKVFLSSATINIRRNVDVLASRLRDARYSFVLAPGDWDPDEDGQVGNDLDALLFDWVGREKSVTIIDLSSAPPAAVPEIVGSVTRVLYDAMYWARMLSEGGRERPLLFIFEEAHSYLGKTANGSAKASVQRIVREGRKYGMGAMIVSQRPSELDTTILSQCGTLVAMRLTNSADRQMVAQAAADNLDGMFSLLPILRTGEALLVGESVPLPTRAIIDLPSHAPDSLDPILVGTEERPGGWDKPRESANYGDVTLAWRSQTARSGNIVEERI